MNNELILILISIREWAVIDSYCKGDYFKLATFDSCNFECDYCPLLQSKYKRIYPDQIIKTFSQLNK